VFLTTIWQRPGGAPADEAEEVEVVRGGPAGDARVAQLRRGGRRGGGQQPHQRGQHVRQRAVVAVLLRRAHRLVQRQHRALRAKPTIT